jgi:serine protease Do
MSALAEPLGHPRRYLLAAVALCFVLHLISSAAIASSLRWTAIVRAVQEAAPSVVNIHGRKTVRADHDESINTSGGFKQVNGMGTGVVIDERGYVVTNYHVIEGVRQIQVTTAPTTLTDGTFVKGKTVIGRLMAHDPSTDLAIVKIDIDAPLPVIRIGTSSDLLAGEPVVAIGNAYGYEHTITRGIISALHRPVQVSDTQKYFDLIQTDASINPGNSGGPLLNIDGDMIGINVAVRMGAQGIGFAVPIDQAVDVASRLLDTEVRRHVAHGVTSRTRTTAVSSQYVVEAVEAGSPADLAGLSAGDVITEMGEIEVKRSIDFERALLGERPGDSITVTFERGGQLKQAQMVLADPRQNQPSISDRSWRILGVKLASIAPRTFQQLESRYNGGLKVIAVRENGPAYNQGIRYGDVLVGMHKWETASMDNLAYILDSDEFRRSQPVKFYILRKGEILYGHLQLAVIGD